MTVTLRKLTKDNWEACIDLKVSPAQQGFMASNLYSIAEVQFLENFEAFAIYKEETVIGFTMFGIDPDDSNYWIYRIMIDEQYQGNGYGKRALMEIINHLSHKKEAREILIGYHPNNFHAEKLYLGSGFEPKGIAPWGEKLASYKIP